MTDSTSNGELLYYFNHIYSLNYQNYEKKNLHLLSITFFYSGIIAQIGLSLSTSLIQPSTCVNGAGTGSFAFNISGGQAPYSWNVSMLMFSGNIASGTDTTNGNILVENLVPGPYVISVTDANGSVATQYVEGITSTNMTVTVNSQQVNTCTGYANVNIYATLNGNPAPNYTVDVWPLNAGITSPATNAAGHSIVSNLPPGIDTYIIVHNGNDCGTFIKWTYTPLPLTISSAFTTPAPCNTPTSGAIDVSVTGATGYYSYAWTGPGNQSFSTQDISGLCAGTYHLTVNSGICTTSQSFVVDGPAYTDYGDITIGSTDPFWNTPHSFAAM